MLNSSPDETPHPSEPFEKLYVTEVNYLKSKGA